MTGHIVHRSLKNIVYRTLHLPTIREHKKIKPSELMRLLEVRSPRELERRHLVDPNTVTRLAKAIVRELKSPSVLVHLQPGIGTLSRSVMIAYKRSEQRLDIANNLGLTPVVNHLETSEDHGQIDEDNGPIGEDNKTIGEGNGQIGADNGQIGEDDGQIGEYHGQMDVARCDQLDKFKVVLVESDRRYCSSLQCLTDEANADGIQTSISCIDPFNYELDDLVWCPDAANLVLLSTMSYGPCIKFLFNQIRMLEKHRFHYQPKRFVSIKLIMIMADEFLARMFAEPGDHSRSRVSVLVETFMSARRLSRSISGSAFFPESRSSGSFVLFQPVEASQRASVTCEELTEVLNLSFTTKNKNMLTVMTRNLRSAARAQTLLDECRIASTLRPYELSTTEFIRLANQYRLTRKPESFENGPAHVL